MKRRSVDPPSTRASPRSRSASRSRSSTSLRLVLCGRSLPSACNSLKLILSPYQEDLRLSQDGEQKGIPMGDPVPELSLCEDHGADLTREALASWRAQPGKRTAADRADHPA